MPLIPQIRKKAYLYPDGPSFTCPECELRISGADPRMWFPDQYHKTCCEECGREYCTFEGIEVILK